MRGPVLVTGAAGFIGQVVVDVLRAKGLAVLAHGRRPAFGIDWVADLADISKVRDTLPDGISAVIHCAAAIPSRSGDFSRDNAAATENFAAALRGMPSLEGVVNLSSVAVYARPPSGRWILAEDAEMVGPSLASDPYAASKRACELALEAALQQRPEVKLSHLRPSSVYGPGMVATTLLPVFVTKALRNEPLHLRGPRGYTQNFVHVRDVAELAVALVLNQAQPRVVNAFSDDTYNLAALADLVRKGLGSGSEIIDATEDTDIAMPVFVNDRAKRLLSAFRKLSDHLRDAA